MRRHLLARQAAVPAIESALAGLILLSTSTTLLFLDLGCWLVTGMLGDNRLDFVLMLAS